MSDPAEPDPDEPRVLRPAVTVLPESAMVPERNLVVPPPRVFTHEVSDDTPFHYGSAAHGSAPDGELPAGRRVVLMTQDAAGERCRVVDAQGLHVEIPCAALRAL